MIKDFINRIVNAGVYPDTSNREAKKIRLLNAFCLCWVCFFILFVTADSLYLDDPWDNIIAHTIALVSVQLTILFQVKRLYLLARLTYLLSSLGAYMAFAIILEPNKFMEFFIVIIPLLSLLFIDNFKINLSILILSFLCFYIPMEVFDLYPGFEKNPLTNFIVFFSAFFILNYFKRLNNKNENLLAEERNHALDANKKIEQQKKELEDLNKFQSHFLVNLSHEIRTPLTLIKGSSSQLKKEKSVEKTLELNERIDQSAEKIKVLVDNIIDLAKMNSNKLELKKKNIEPTEFCRKICTSFSPLFLDKNIAFAFTNFIEDGGISLPADILYLERAINNIILNAYKYTDIGGATTVSIRLESKQFKLEIQDTGCGIHSDDLPRIFDSFYRGQNAINEAGGSGVGLSFSKEVIALHNGELLVESVLGTGTKFTILLPASKSNHRPEKHRTRSLSQDVDNINILLVDDNKEMREYLCSILDEHFLRQASSGLEALKILREYSPDIIITDYMMPGMNGYEFIKQVKNDGLDIPVIVLTARMDEQAKLDFLRLGIDDYLTKPFNEEELQIRLQHSVDNYKERNKFNTDTKDEEPIQAVNAELQQITDIIHSNLSSTTFNIADLAEHIMLTERTLYRKIKSLTGLTPNEFIREIKLLKAHELCANNEIQSLKELTITLGLKNSNYLSKLYEARFGKKPLE